jgi:S-adenosylmethionine hydrolase
MKGVALSITDTRIVDISHEISPQNILEGAFVLRTAVPYFPMGTVHVAVVDPGVGTERRGLVIATKSQILVGPDNGLLIPAANYLDDFTVYEIKNPDLMLKNISNTYHGRDIFTPVAAHILNGILFDQIGPIINDFKTFDFGTFELTNEFAIGKIIFIDRFGNIITNINGEKLKKIIEFNKVITLMVGRKKLKVSFVKSYDHVKSGEFLTTIGSSNHFEISQNKGDASKRLKLNINDKIKIVF